MELLALGMIWLFWFSSPPTSSHGPGPVFRLIKQRPDRRLPCAICRLSISQGCRSPLRGIMDVVKVPSLLAVILVSEVIHDA